MRSADVSREHNAVGRVGCPGARYRPRPAIELRALDAERRLRGRDVLEIGAGDGRLTFALATVARRVVAIDPDGEAIDRGRAEARSRGLTNVRFASGTAQRPGVGRERFDVAVFSWAL